MDRPWAEVIQENPIAEGLDDFRVKFRRLTKATSENGDFNHLSPNELRDLVFALSLALQGLSAAPILCTANGQKIVDELAELNAAIRRNDVELDRFQPLLRAVVNKADDFTIWNLVKSTVSAEATPPPRSLVSSFQQTPCLRNTSSFPNSSEHRKYVDDILKEELGQLYVGIPKFWDKYFGGIDDLETASEEFFQQSGASQDGVLNWFAEFNKKLAAFAADRRPSLSHHRRPLAKPNKPISGSVGKRKLDIGFVSDPEAQKDTGCHWSQILVPGELKSNPSADKAAEAWLDLGRYAREVLAAQDTRRFVFGFTICGSLMRVWLFDRLGGIASEQFDVNKDGLRFISIILRFLWMSEEELGFDSTIRKVERQKFIEIERNGSKERVIIDRVIMRARCIAGRATTCWQAHPEGHPEIPLVIKDSWQYPERDEEGEMLSGVMDQGVTNVARYYHHETVRVNGMDDDIRNSVRQGLDMTTASNYQPSRPQQPSRVASTGPRKSRASSSRKRPSSQTDSDLPPSKRTCSASPTKAATILPNRVHRRVIVKDYGKAIYKASSRRALLAGLEGCIEGYESLYHAGFLHRDISVNNLMINEDEDNPSWPSFLIDLDLAVREDRVMRQGQRARPALELLWQLGRF